MESDPRFVRITNETATREQLALSEEIASLKSVTHMPSLAIFNLLKAEREIDRVLNIADPERPFKITRSEFQQFSDEVRVVALFSIELHSIGQSTIQNGGVFTQHSILKVFEDPANVDKGLFLPNAAAGHYVWHLNYGRFFQKFFVEIDEQYRFSPEGGLNVDSVVEILSNHKLLTLVQTGRRASLLEIEDNEELRSVSDKDLLHEKYKALADPSLDLMAQRKAIHDHWARLSLKYIRSQSELMLYWSSASDAREPEVNQLYRYNELYDRALRENALSQPEVRRAIVRAFVMNRLYYDHNLFRDSPFPYERLLKYARRIIAGPGNVAELTLEEQQRATQRRSMGQYILSALIENRNYLRKFFSSAPYLADE